MRVAIAHDYLTQRGGAERVVLTMAEAFPEAPIYTSLFEPAGTYPEFADLDVRTSSLNRIGVLRRHHRYALPFLARSFGSTVIDADVVIASSSGWAHGVTAPGAKKLVYCHSPARWLYLRDDYGTSAARRAAMRLFRSPLLRWDQAAAASADSYLANSSVVQERIAQVYGIHSEVLHPPHVVNVDGRHSPMAQTEPGFFLVVSRLMGYKNVDAVIAAMSELPAHRLIVVGEGPQRDSLVAAAPDNVGFVRNVDDARLRWLYANCLALVSAAHEDFGLTPIEAASFGKPSVTLSAGGFLDSVRPDQTGVFFDTPEPGSVAKAMLRAADHPWNEAELRSHAARFSKKEFVLRLRSVVAALAVTDHS
ncbi:MAG: glycosyltransferase [Acidimicrobiia bacterium]